MKAIIETTNGNRKYVSLPAPTWEGRRDIRTGVEIHALYYGPRTGRIVAEYYSIWATQNGGCVGRYYQELTEDDALRVLRHLPVEPADVGIESEDI